MVRCVCIVQGNFQLKQVISNDLSAQSTQNCTQGRRIVRDVADS